MYGYYYRFDPTMILVLIGVLLSAMASAKVNSTFNRYSRVRSACGMTGAEVAMRLLNSQGIYDVSVRQVRGSLTVTTIPEPVRSTCPSRYTALPPLRH